MMKRSIPFLLLSIILYTSCSLLNSDTSSSPDGWFQVTVPFDTTKNDRPTIRDLYFLNRDVGWIVGRVPAEVGYKAYIGYTENGGGDWDFKYPDGSAELQAVYFLNPEQGVFSDNPIYFTQDGIRTFKRVNNYEHSRIDHLDFSSSSNGWAAGLAGSVAKTTNSGQTWNYMDLGYDKQRFVSISAIGEQHAWLLLSNNLLLRTNDAGADWQKTNLADVTEASPVRYNAITFTSARRGWAVGDFRRILHTTDGGQNWTLQYPKSEDQRSFDAFTAISAYDSLNAMAVSSHGAILRTSDGGETWKEQLPAKDEGGSFIRVQFVDSEVAYAAGGSRLMKTVTGGKTEDNR
jgi:photosystem II stability/assembly factor-like uncharacterized protein